MKLRNVFENSHVDAMKRKASGAKKGAKEWPTGSDPAKHRVSTTDDRYHRVDHDTWWDRGHDGKGIDLVHQHVVDKHLHNNPGVGLVKRRLGD